MTEVTISLGGRTLNVYPLNFKAVQKFAPLIGKLGSQFAIGDLALVRDLIGSSLNRQGQTVDEEFLDENLDLANAKDILSAVLQASGIAKGPEAKATSEGEENRPI